MNNIDFSLPIDWTWDTLDSVGNIYAGSSAPQDEKYFIDGTFPFVRVQDLGREKRTTNLTITVHKLNSLAINECHLVKAKPGTILFPKSGAAILTNNRALLGMPAYIVSHLAAIEPNQEWDEKWVFYWLCLVDLRQYINNPAYPSLNLTEIKKIPIPKPRTRQIQRQIVARIEALLSEVREMREINGYIGRDVNQLMSSAIIEVFSPANISSWPNSEPFVNLVKIEAELVNPKLDQYKNLPHIHGGVIEQGNGQLLPYRTAVEDGMTSAKYNFKAYSILYSKIRPYLKKAILVDFQGLCSADMYPVEVINPEKIMPEFVMWTLLSPDFTNYAISLSERARMPKLNRVQLLGYQFHYPTREIQEKICQHLRIVRDEVKGLNETVVQNSLLISQLEQSILAQAFRGEL